MTCTVENFSFKDFKFPSQAAERPESYFNILPYRIWEHEADCSDTINQVTTDWKAVTGKDVSQSIGTQASGLPLFLASDCPPHILTRFVRFGYIAFFWDDATDALDSAAHEKIQLDLRAAFLSEVKLGRRNRCEFEINELYMQSLVDLLNEANALNTLLRHNYDLFYSGLQAQTVPALHTVTWEAYKVHRIKSIGSRVLSRLVPAIYGACISDEELNSVSPMLELGDLITGLTNDFHSFHKEFDKHFLAGTLDIIHNGMAVLMSNYGYDEQEAGNILKQEVLAAEAILMTEYEKLELFAKS
ncbi:isoprenoid synthase domain-containing protein [Aspergillus spinulosporus]